MPDAQVKDTQGPQEIPAQTKQPERRTQTRNEGVLGQIEDATYAILRKHESRSS